MTRLNVERSDNRQLKALLSNETVTAELPDLGELAKDSSAEPGPIDAYRAVAPAFCDGFEVDLGVVERELVSQCKPAFQNAIQGRAQDIRIKNILIHTREQKAIMWFTLTPESAQLTPRTIQQLRNVLEATKRWARYVWRLDDEQLDAITMTKIDCAVDFKGSFLPHSDTLTYYEI